MHSVSGQRLLEAGALGSLVPGGGLPQRSADRACMERGALPHREEEHKGPGQSKLTVTSPEGSQERAEQQEKYSQTLSMCTETGLGATAQRQNGAYKIQTQTCANGACSNSQGHAW